MSKMRRFGVAALSATAVLAATFSLARAAQPAPSPLGGLEQIQHVIIFMQENRAFDHYYGTLRGVRGWADRSSHPLPSGLNEFYQPVDQKNLSQYMLPFHVDTMTTSAICMSAPVRREEERRPKRDGAGWRGGGGATSFSLQRLP